MPPPCLPRASPYLPVPQVMTTNHPEILDPALIRPGRIDQRLLLGYMRWNNVVQMIEHYFQLGEGGLDEALARRVKEAILGSDAKGVPALNLTPAQVEQRSTPPISPVISPDLSRSPSTSRRLSFPRSPPISPVIAPVSPVISRDLPRSPWRRWSSSLPSTTR